MEIGRKIYYDKLTGNVILDTGERQGSVVETTVEQDIEAYTVLSERNRDTFEVLELAFGYFAQDFAECNGYRVNVETKELEFSYPDPNVDPETPPIYVNPLTKKVTELEERLALSEAALDFLIMNGGI